MSFALPRRAFTLVELLVVIGIIAILIAILLPSLNKARDSAIRTKCAANLRVWGQAVHNYAADNRGKIPMTWMKGGSPATVWFDERAALEWPFGTSWPKAELTSELSVSKMYPYIQGVPTPEFHQQPSGRRGGGIARQTNVVDQVLSGAWHCPAVSDGQPVKPGWFYETAGHIHYAYFAHSSEWAAATLAETPKPEELVDKRLSAERVLMCDMLLYRTGKGWFYNHGKRGPVSVSDPMVQGDVWGSSIDNFSGMNRLMGDGSVHWKQSGDFELHKIRQNPERMDVSRVNENFY